MTSRRAGYLLALLCLAGVSSILDRQLISILVGPIKSDLLLDDVQIAVVHGAAFAVSYALLAFPLARYADVGDRRALIATGLIVWSVATGAAALSTGFAMFVLARVFVGVGEAALSPATYSLLADVYTRERLGRSIGIFHSAVASSVGVSVFAGGALTGWFSGHLQAGGELPLDLAPWRVTMLTIAAPGVVLAALLLFTVREPARLHARTRENTSLRAVKHTLLANRGLLLVAILGFCPLAMSSTALPAWVPAHIMRNFDWPPERVALWFGSAIAITAPLGPLVAGFVADACYSRFGARAPLVVLIGFTALALVNVTAVLVPSPVISLLISAVGFALYATAHPLMAAFLQLNTPRGVDAQIAGLWVCLYNLAGWGLGPLTVAILTEHVYGDTRAVGSALALMMGVCTSLALITWLYVLRKHVRAMPQPRAAVAG